MSDELFMLQLGGDGDQFSSGRAVQLAVIDDDTYDDLLAHNAAPEDADDAARLRCRRSFGRARLRASLRSVTRDPVPLEEVAGKRRRNARKLPEEAWVPVNAQSLEMPSSPNHVDKLFSRTDRELLQAIVGQMHEPTMETVERAMGEIRAVSSG